MSPMDELTPENRERLIEKMGRLTERLSGALSGPRRDDLMAQLRRLKSQLWPNGKPAP
jgi:hypothetical protein